MLIYTLKRLGLAALVAFAVSALAFLLLRLSGDVAIAIAGEGARAEDIAAIRQQYGLDRPLVMQYLEWLGRTLSGDFGQSLYFKSPVVDLIREKIATTLILALTSIGFALLVSVPLGVMAAIWQNSWIDRLCLAIAVVGQALPNFFFALCLVMVFSIGLRWLPVSGTDGWENFIMPTVT
jgi:glutathione transport system permease protein